MAQESEFNGVREESVPASRDTADQLATSDLPPPASPPLHTPPGTSANHPWREAIGWMLLLSLLFLVGYSVTNHWAATQPDAVSLHTAWDDKIPFLDWTIWPYLSLNLIFPCTFFAFDHAHAMRRHAARIAAAQISCFAAFMFIPSVNIRPLPTPDGVTGLLFNQLRAFEQPYNMFPSLHAATLLLVWMAWLPKLQNHPVIRRAWHGWCLLILISTATTWQHDLWDVVMGLTVGLAVLAIWPVRCSTSR